MMEGVLTGLKVENEFRNNFLMLKLGINAEL
jgi:hypothetical protein